MDQENKFETRVDLTELQHSVADIKAELAKIIVGQTEMIELLVTAILSDGHVLIEGVPGVAKTLTAKLIAKTMDTDFSRIQFTPDLMPSDVLGTSLYNFKTSEFTFNAGPIFSNIVLIDEINRAPAKTQAALFEVMEERQITVDGNSYQMETPFMVLATQNPIEQEGTYRLPEAQLDRFLFKINVEYPSLDEEIGILQGFHNRKNVNDLSVINAILNTKQINDFREKVRAVLIEENLMKYIAKLVNETRNNKDLFLGASPRASINILTASKATAAMAGRDFVTPEDIKKVCLPILRHRVIPTPEREMEGISSDEIIQQVIQTIEIPR